MYTTIIHPLRKALCLSCNEYCVLDAIYKLSNNSKYGGWCIQKNQKIAEELDISKRTIITVKKTLNTKGYIDIDEHGNSRPSEFIRELFVSSSDWKIGKMSDTLKLISGKFNFAGGEEVAPNSEEVAPQGVKKLHSRGEEVAPIIQIDTNNNISSDTEKEKPSKKHLFRNSVYFDNKEKLKEDLYKRSELNIIADIDYYYDSVLDWSDGDNNKKINWLATVNNWIRRDEKDGKLKKNKSKTTQSTHIANFI